MRLRKTYPMTVSMFLSVPEAICSKSFVVDEFSFGGFLWSNFKRDLRLIYRRVIQYDDGLDYMKKKNLDIFFEISSKTGDNVINLFERVANSLITKSIQMQNLRQSLVDADFNKMPPKKKEGCC